jgi:hypothetical protein
VPPSHVIHYIKQHQFTENEHRKFASGPSFDAPFCVNLNFIANLPDPTFTDDQDRHYRVGMTLSSSYNMITWNENLYPKGVLQIFLYKKLFDTNIFINDRKKLPYAKFILWLIAPKSDRREHSVKWKDYIFLKSDQWKPSVN